MSSPTWSHTGADAGAARGGRDAHGHPPHAPALSFRLGTSAQFFDELARRLRATQAKGDAAPSAFPFADLGATPDSDWVTALLASWSGVGDILSFYQERLINEGFLRTAREPQSLELLLRGMGVRRGVAWTRGAGAIAPDATVGLDPGCAATVDVLLRVADTRGVPTRVASPAGTALRMVGGATSVSTHLQTDHAFTARREWNAMPAYRPPPAPATALRSQAPGVLLEGITTGLNPGDRLLLTGRDPQGGDVVLLRTVTSVRVLPPASATEVTWTAETPDQAAAAALTAPRIFRFRQEYGLLGANATPLAGLSRRRRLDEGVVAGGVSVSSWLPDAPAPWQALNVGLPAAGFLSVLALGDGRICVGADDGVYCWHPDERRWATARSGMLPRAITTLVRGPGRMLLAGGANGGVYRTEDPLRGWDSLAGGFVVGSAVGKPAAVKAALPLGVVRRLAHVEAFPGGAAIVALTDSGLYVQQSSATWLRVDMRPAGAAAPAPLPRWSDFLFADDGRSVALCHSGGVVRWPVAGAVEPTAAPHLAGSVRGAGVLARARSTLAAAGARWQQQVGRRRLVETEPGAAPQHLLLRTLGTRQPTALAPLSSRLGDGDLLVGTTAGAVVCDRAGRLWGASAGLPTGADGVPCGVAQLAWSFDDDRLGILASVCGAATGLYRFIVAERRWESFRATAPAEGPVLLSMGPDGGVAIAQTPIPAVQWPGFALDVGAPSATPVPSVDDGLRAVALDIDGSTSGIAPGSLVLLHEPSGTRPMAAPVLQAASAMADAFGLKRRITRAWVALPRAATLSGFDRRCVRVFAQSVELFPMRADAALVQPVGLEDALRLAGMVPDLAIPLGESACGLLPTHVARHPPSHPGTPAPLATLASAPATASPARRMAVSGRNARLLPAGLGGVLSLPGWAVSRPARALAFHDVVALSRHGPLLMAGCLDGDIHSSPDGTSWQLHSSCASAIGSGLRALAGAPNRLWAVGSGGVASSTNGDWAAAAPLPAGGAPTCLAVTGDGRLWVGTIAGLVASSDQGRTWHRHAGGALDPDVSVTALLSLADGRLLVATDGDGVIVAATDGMGWSVFGGPIGRGRVACLAAAAGRVLAGTPDAGIFACDAARPAWSAAGQGPDDGILAAACSPTHDIVAGRGAGLFWRDAAQSAWQVLPVGLAGQAACLLALADPGFPPVVAGVRTRLPLGLKEDAPTLAFELVVTLGPQAGALLEAGVLGPALRRDLVDAGVHGAAQAQLVALAGGRGWLLHEAGKNAASAPLFLLPAGRAIRVLRSTHMPLGVDACRLDGRGWRLALAPSVQGLAPPPFFAYPDEIVFLPSSTVDPSFTRVCDIVDSQLADDGSHTCVTLAEPLSLAIDPATLLANGNVVGASQGRTVGDEVLGDGRADLAGQQFRLRQPPLTFLRGERPDSRRSTLVVAVDGVAWREVASFVGSDPRAHVFTVDVDAMGGALLTFGDGESGARLPTGAGNVRASYRSGMDPMPDMLPLDQQPAGSTSLVYLLAGSGGLSKDAKVVLRTPAVAAEDIDQPRLALPGRFGVAGRLVTDADYARWLARLPVVALTRADRLSLLGARPMLLVTVMPRPGAGPRWLAQVKAALRAGQAAGARPVEVLPAEAVPVCLSVRIWTQAQADGAGLLAAAKKALLHRFGPTHVLAAGLSEADVLGVLQGVADVAGAEVLLLHLKSEPQGRHAQLRALPARFDGGALRPAQQLHLLDDPGALSLSLAAP